MTSIEINPKHCDIILENIKASLNTRNAEVMLRATLDVLPKLSKILGL